MQTVWDCFFSYSKISESKPSWKANEKYQVSRFVRFVENNQVVDRAALEHFRAQRLLSVSPASVNREMNSISSFLRYCHEIGFLAQNPADRLSRYSVSHFRSRVLERAEAATLFAAARADPNLKVYAIIRFLHDTGARPCELKNLRWLDIHIDTPRPFCLIRSSKTGRSRKVFLTPAAISALVALPRVSPWVLSSWPRNAIRRVCADLRDFQLYDLRKNFITRACRVSPIKHVSLIVGCSPAVIMKYYQGIDDAELQDVALSAVAYERQGAQLSLIDALTLK